MEANFISKDMKPHTNTTGGGSFSSPSFTSPPSLEGRYTVTDTGYLLSDEGQKLFIGGSSHPLHQRGLWTTTSTGKPKYISTLKPHPTKVDTFIFDTLPHREKHLLILKEDRAVIVRAGGER